MQIFEGRFFSKTKKGKVRTNQNKSKRMSVKAISLFAVIFALVFQIFTPFLPSVSAANLGTYAADAAQTQNMLETLKTCGTYFASPIIKEGSTEVFKHEGSARYINSSGKIVETDCNKIFADLLSKTHLSQEMVLIIIGYSNIVGGVPESSYYIHDTIYNALKENYLGGNKKQEVKKCFENSQTQSGQVAPFGSLEIDDGTLLAHLLLTPESSYPVAESYANADLARCVSGVQGSLGKSPIDILHESVTGNKNNVYFASKSLNITRVLPDWKDIWECKGNDNPCKDIGTKLYDQISGQLGAENLEYNQKITASNIIPMFRSEFWAKNNASKCGFSVDAKNASATNQLANKTAGEEVTLEDGTIYFQYSYANPDDGVIKTKLFSYLDKKKKTSLDDYTGVAKRHGPTDSDADLYLGEQISGGKCRNVVSAFKRYHSNNLAMGWSNNILAEKNATGDSQTPEIPKDDSTTVEGESTCKIDGGLGWILCPMVDTLAKAADGLYYSFLEPNLAVSATSVIDAIDDGANSVYRNILNLANIILGVVFLIVIVSSMFTGEGNGLLSNYNFKKTLPKLIIFAILVNVSIYACAIIVDLTNIAGAGVSNIISGFSSEKIETFESERSTFSNLSSMALTGTGAFVIGGGALLGATGGLVPAVIALAIALLGAIISVLMIFFILSLRQAAVVILIAISPLAFAAAILPNTESLFKKWWKAFSSLLVVYPIVAFVFAGSKVAGDVLTEVNAVDSNFWGAVTAALCYVLPLFTVPSLLKGSLSGLGKIGGTLSGKLGGLSGKATGKARVAYKGSDTAADARFGKTLRHNARKNGEYKGLAGKGRYARDVLGLSAGSTFKQAAAANLAESEEKNIKGKSAFLRNAQVKDTDGNKGSFSDRQRSQVIMGETVTKDKRKAKLDENDQETGEYDIIDSGENLYGDNTFAGEAYEIAAMSSMTSPSAEDINSINNKYLESVDGRPPAINRKSENWRKAYAEMLTNQKWANPWLSSEKVLSDVKKGSVTKETIQNAKQNYARNASQADILTLSAQNFDSLNKKNADGSYAIGNDAHKQFATQAKATLLNEVNASSLKGGDTFEGMMKAAGYATGKDGKVTEADYMTLKNDRAKAKLDNPVSQPDKKNDNKKEDDSSNQQSDNKTEGDSGRQRGDWDHHNN